MDSPAGTQPPADRSGDDAGRLRLVVTRLARRLRQNSPEGLTTSQMSALAVIDHLGPVSMGELAAFENVQPPTMSRIVRSLEEVGWVERVTDPTDRRVSLVQATAVARSELARLRADRDAFLARRLDALAPAHRAAVLAALPALEALLADEDGG